MARASKPKTPIRSSPKAAKRRGRVAAAAPRAAAKTPGAKGPASKASAAKASLAPKVSKDELRAQIEKFERTVATLRAKNREMGAAAKSANARVAELEIELEKLQKAVAATPPKPPRERAPKTPRRTRDIDPGDAVPPGVAVQDPEPMDEEAKTAFENLEEHLSGE